VSATNAAVFLRSCAANCEDDLRVAEAVELRRDLRRNSSNPPRELIGEIHPAMRGVGGRIRFAAF